MKILIVTINEWEPNFGNRLQAYATGYMCERSGAYVQIACFDKTIRQYLKFLIKYSVQKFIKKKYYKDTLRNERIKNFERFNRKYLPNYFVKDTNKLENKFDYFVTGSDQVWNAAWYKSNPLKKDMYLLSFARPEQKVCMSPSFGTAEITTEWKSFFCEQLKSFPNLSVREESGAELIHDLTGKTAEVLIDPTLMLSASEWLKISEKPKDVSCECDYILTYFLGTLSEERKKLIDELAQQNNWKMYSLLDVSQEDLYRVNPSEFIYLLEHAKLILTDSFHACVFSFLFKKPFKVFEREGVETGMFNRIQHLLDLFYLQDKKWDGDFGDDLLNCDYSKGYKQLEVERAKVKDFLNKSFEL